MTDIEKLRREKSAGMVGYYLQLLAAVIWVAGAYFAASNGNLFLALVLLGPVPFAVVAAAQAEQSRVNRALLAEIDSLRFELSARSRT